MPPWREDAGRPSHEVLRERCYAGARKRYGAELHETVVDRIEHELATILRMGFSTYFLVVEEIVKRSPRICGRGSGAASIVAYSLGITNVCPVKFNLYFERFLNPGRKDPPDIDVDFAWDERDAAIASVLDEFRDHSAMVACFANFQPRMAIRETAKVFGLTDAEIGQVSKRLPWFWRELASDLGSDDDELLDRLREMPEMKDLDFPEPWPEILQLAQRLIGIPRHISVHPGGVVITPDPIDGYVPVEIAPKGVPIIQWEKDSAESAGLVKIDLLGNRSLAVIRDAVANVQANGTPFDESRWEPEDDPATQASIAAGATMGCFYIESPATRLLQQKARRGDYEHVVIHSSIIRPAANKWIHEYLRRLHGGAWQPIHPLLEGVLDDNYGIMVYQEDVAKAAMALAGFDHVEADGLRKVMSKKDRAKRLPDYLRRFIAGARSRGVSTEQIEAVWEMILSFDGYSFCKPHSASYARVSFQAAYLKTHFPAEFMAAVITNQGGFYSTSAYVSETRRLGVRVLPPDVNHSEIPWKGAAGTVRVGWLTLHHLGAETRGRIVAQRPYRDVVDFLERARPDEEEARVLVHARAFDGLHPNESHAALLWQIAAWRKSMAGRRSHDLFTRAAETPRPSPGTRRSARPLAGGNACAWLSVRRPPDEPLWRSDPFSPSRQSQGSFALRRPPRVLRRLSRHRQGGIHHARRSHGVHHLRGRNWPHGMHLLPRDLPPLLPHARPPAPLLHRRQGRGGLRCVYPYGGRGEQNRRMSSTLWDLRPVNGSGDPTVTTCARHLSSAFEPGVDLGVAVRR